MRGWESAHERCTVRALGQAAFLTAGVGLTLTATQDLDAYADYDWAVQQELERLLAKNGKVFDPHGHEVWMPRETRYDPLYQGRYVEALVADPDAVLISKALKAPEKNKPMIKEYLAKGARASGPARTKMCFACRGCARICRHARTPR